MAPEQAILDKGGLIFVACYLALLLLLGVAGRMMRKEKSLEDFYLGGRGFGMFVLLMTLYATQYSGNTLLGFAGRAYREGFTFLYAPLAMMAIIGGYLIYAPRLYRLSRRDGYITTSDFLQARFGCRKIAVLASLIGIVAACNHILTNLKAMGFLVEEASGGMFPLWQGILGLSLIMVIYETLGGMRSVAWTDVLQGLLLLGGCAIIFVVIIFKFDGMELMSRDLREIRPDFWAPPDWKAKFAWLSSIILLGLGISVYPYAVQRIYSARSENALRRSLQIMVFMPIFTTFFMVVVGWVGAAMVPELDRAGSDRITVSVINLLAAEFPPLKFLLVLLIGAVIAAIMSTIDSALLSISSFFTQDLYRPLRPKATQAELTYVGKLFSWVLMAVMAGLAIVSQNTIWRLLEIKLEILIQIAPAIYLGLHVKKLKAGPVLAGMVAGTGFTLVVMIANKLGLPMPASPLGVHAGVWGLLINLAVICLASREPGLVSSNRQKALQEN